MRINVSNDYWIIMTLPKKNIESDFLGDLEPIRTKGAKAQMDRRQVSFRWLGGSFLTGLASVFLMGGALLAALDGRQNLAVPAKAYQKLDEQEASTAIAIKGNKPGLTAVTDESERTNLMMVSTVTREGDQDVVKLKPFMHIAAPLAAIPRKETSYPAFDALAIFSETGKAEPIAASADLIYGADVEGEISLKTSDFPYGDSKISLARRQNTDEIETIVRNAAPGLNTGGTALSSITFFDSARFSSEDTTFVNTPGLTITTENVSVVSRTFEDEYPGIHYQERFARVKNEAPITLVLQGEGLSVSDANDFSNAIASNLASASLLPDDRLRMMFKMDNKNAAENEDLIRVSVYRGGRHLVSVAKKDTGDYVFANEPAPIPEQTAPDPSRPMLTQSKLPSIYDAIYRSAMGEGITKETANSLIRIFAFDVDFNAAIGISDTMEIFLSLEDGEIAPSDGSEILFASIKLGDTERRYYRFRDPETGLIDYYDETGKSAKQFLLRQPVPNGRFNNGFGMRRHPITGVRKMHTGADWSAPRGAPILAAGNGVIEKAGWAGGYGRQIIIRHANGYKTSYNHQTGFAKGIREGVQVRQGQVIGYVGSTGLSTGPHLHYEVLVNGNKVDPMRIKLPRGKVFRGAELAAFEAERERIDNLLEDRKLATQRFARN